MIYKGRLIECCCNLPALQTSSMKYHTSAHQITPATGSHTEPESVAPAAVLN